MIYLIGLFSDDCSIVKQIEVRLNQTAESVLAHACKEFDDDDDYNVKDCCFKTLYEDSYIFGSRQLVEFAYIHDHICSNSIPNLVLVRVNSVEVEKVGDSVYVMLDKDMQMCNTSETTPPSISRSGSESSTIARTASESSTTLELFRQTSSFIHAGELKQPFAVLVECLNLTPYLSGSQVSNSPGSIGIQIGLFHGAKRLCPTITQFLKTPLNNNGTIFSVQKVKK